MIRTNFALAALAFVAACGCRETPPAAPAPLQDLHVAAWMGEWDPSLGTACVKGVAKLDGKAPERTVIDMKQEAHCVKAHEGDPALSETVIAGADGTLQNVFVYVKDGLEPWKFPAPTEAVVIDQVHCHYVPHIIGAQLGQPIKVRNSDPILHNIHGLPTRSKEFNIGQSKQGMEDSIEIKRAEVMIPIGCEVHGWMRAYLGVVKHPFFRVTGAGGTFDLSGLPPGKFVIEAWHEAYGTLTQEIEIGDKETKEIAFTFTATAK